MELLLEDTHDRDGRSRALLLGNLRRVEDWTVVAEELSGADSEGFALLLATIEPPDDAAFDSLVRWSISRCVFSASFWGPGCEIAHDTFDEIDVILQIDAGVASENMSFVMTSWHPDETLEEALDFFWDYAIVGEGKVYGPKRVVLAVDPDGHLAEQVRTWARE